jgi:hypothetical protein
MLVFYLADQCWLASLEAHSPVVPSPASGLTVGLQMHGKHWWGPVFYVRPFEATIHYGLTSVWLTAFVAALCNVFRRLLLRRS